LVGVLRQAIASKERASAQFGGGKQHVLTFLSANPNSLMLEAASRETNAVRDHMLLLGCGTAEEKFAKFIIGWRAKLGRGVLSRACLPW
jgi:ethanolamine utilization microcompartment shell protein EutS